MIVFGFSVGVLRASNDNVLELKPILSQLEPSYVRSSGSRSDIKSPRVGRYQNGRCPVNRY